MAEERARRKCALPDCDITYLAQTRYCDHHYRANRLTGDPYSDISAHRRRAEDRFWEKVNKHGGFPDFIDSLVRVTEADGECWVWAGGINRDGYGHITVGGRQPPAHRYSYELLVSPIPRGLRIDHLCRRRSCVNPDHLEPVTHLENIGRGRHNQRDKTHCKHGHEYTAENTMHRTDHPTGRRCRQCYAKKLAKSKSRKGQ